MWTSGKLEIDGGRISKLAAYIGSKEIMNYSRGWDSSQGTSG